MNSILGSLLKVDLSQVSPSVLEGLHSGTMQLWGTNGTVSWAAGQAQTGIVQHLPLIPVTPEDLANPQQLLELSRAVQSANTAALTATAISTVAIIGVVVVATVYLASKIDAVHKSIHELTSLVGRQNVDSDLRLVTTYAGALQAARELLAASSAPSASAVANDLAKSRNGSLAYLAKLRGRLLVKDIPVEEMKRSLMLSIELLDMIPTAFSIERDISLLTGERRLAYQLGQGPLADYRRHVVEFRDCCRELYRRLASGEGGPAEALREQRPALQRLFESPINEFLLAGLADPATPNSSAPSPLDVLMAMPSDFSRHV